MSAFKLLNWNLHFISEYLPVLLCKSSSQTIDKKSEMLEKSTRHNLAFEIWTSRDVRINLPDYKLEDVSLRTYLIGYLINPIECH